MKDSGYFSADQLPRYTALSYIDEEDGSYRTNIFSVPIKGGSDGGAYISAADMTRFWRALKQGELLSEQSNQALFRAHVRTSEADKHGYYGHGVWLRERQDGLWESFVQGWDPGVAMISGVLPPGEMVITVLSNTNAPVWKVYALLIEQLCS